MQSAEIVKTFLDFFAARDHRIVPSSSLIPQGDPTLLFTNAGMVQFKSYFAGEATPPHRRLASLQKCFRTTDIDRVGDTSHLTFFEMLGNFSIGDYFKEEAISLAWEFVTKYLGLSSSRLWVSIYLDDDPAEKAWLKVGVPKQRIIRLGKEDNFWGPAGETGPCGPDSEIFFDLGPAWQKDDKDTTPSAESQRFLEIWNLVFMEFHQDKAKQLHPLPSKNIDTGMGLERMAAVMQKVHNLYETDLFQNIIAAAAAATGRKYGEEEEVSRSLRIIAEHTRAATFLIADGVMPANDGRGYVLRRILRKAIFHGRRLGRVNPFLEGIVQIVSDSVVARYPALRDRQSLLSQVVNSEEERFHRTLEVGAGLLNALLEDPEAKELGVIPGEDVFRLYDTYGLPVDFTRDMAAERGLAIDEQGFQEAMAGQKEKGRAAAKFEPEKSGEVLRELKLRPTKFEGYKSLETKAQVRGLIKDGRAVTTSHEGEEIEIVLDQTPFYAEAGGQVGDTGMILGPQGKIRVQDTQSPWGGVTLHYGRVEEGSIRIEDEVTASVDGERRRNIMRNHTATHLLHKALREILGPHALQAGSLVAPDRLRFDFSHTAPLSKEERVEVEKGVNEKIRENLPVGAKIMPYSEAIAAGAVALFGEKYGDEVRVISVGDYSRELCGGTHLRATGEIGLFTIVEESAIGAGLRRIEALTGRGAEEHQRSIAETLQELAHKLKTPPAQVIDKVESLLREVGEQKRKISRLSRKEKEKQLQEFLSSAAAVKGVKVIARIVDVEDSVLLREMSDWLKEHAGSAAILLATQIDGRNHFLAALSPDLVKKGFKAGEIAKHAAEVAGGSGGGRPNLAEGGGGDPKKLSEAVNSTLGFIAQLLAHKKG